ncbi:hypothetical protein BJX70DRAFT_393815 [Aspergillus crustosus]
MSNALRAQHFCTRPDGTLTPLVAVDELPANISIRGVPRVLSPSETQGMTSLGSVNSRGQFYTIEGTPAFASRPPSAGPGIASHRTRSYELQSSLMKLLAEENIPTNQRVVLNSLLQQGLSPTWPMTSSSASGWMVPSTGGSSSSGSGQQGSHFRNVKKEYCSYWIRHGECDYQQQGCLYKHEMPHDRSMLEKLGLRDIPRWYREKFNIPSILPNGHGSQPRPPTANNQPWKDDASYKSLQYPLQLGIGAAGEQSSLDKGLKHEISSYIPSQQHQQTALLSGTSQLAFHSMGSPTVPIPQTQTPINSPRQFSTGSKKIDLLSFDHQEYMSNPGFLRRPSNEVSFEAPGRANHEGLRNLQSFTFGSGTANTDYLHGPFDSTVGSGRSKKLQRQPRLYQPRYQDIAPDARPEQTENDSLRAFHNQAAASSSGASVTSKTTGSQLASPVADAVRGSVTSEPPTRAPSPTSLSSSASPGVFQGRGKDKEYRKALGAIGTKKTFRKRSTESSEDDLFFHGKK